MSGKNENLNYKLDLGYLLDINFQTPAIYDLTDRFHHALIIGKTGMGKSVLMERMAYYDIKQGISVIYIDPKGESVNRIYNLAEDKAKLRYISIDQPLVINPLKKKGYEIDEIISEFVQILDILITLTTINPESTVLMREIIGMAIKGLKEEDKNLDYLVNFLLYEDVRKKHKFLNNEVLKYWEEFDAFDRNIRRNREKIESAKRVAARLLEICDGRMRRFVIGDNELYISELLANGQSLLVNTARMSRTARIYLSNLIVYAVVSYCAYEAKHERPLLVYVDEFQTIVSRLFSDLLARSRSAKVGFVLAHHDFEEIDNKVLSSIFGNVNMFVVFRCGDREAERMANLFGLKAKSFLDLDKFNAWLRIGTDNILIETFPPLTPDITSALPSILFPSQPNFLRDGWIPF